MRSSLGIPLVGSVSSVLMAALLLAGCDLALGQFSSEAREEWTRSYVLAEGGQVEVRNTNGPIEVRASTGDQVEVVAERIARAGSDGAARELLQRVEIVEQVSPDSVRLESRVPSGGGLFGAGTEVRYTLAVPAGARVRVQTMNGKLDIDGVRGGLDASTTNGGITARGLGGAVEAHTTNGGIEIDVDEVAQGGLSMSTTNGGIEVRIPRGARADLRAQVTNGGIDASGLDGFEPVGEMGRRHLDGRLNGGGPALTARTTNGGIRIAAR